MISLIFVRYNMQSYKNKEGKILTKYPVGKMGSTQAEETMTLFKSDGRFFDQKMYVLFQCCTSYKGACEQ
jgi:hypothetical protein